MRFFRNRKTDQEQVSDTQSEVTTSSIIPGPTVEPGDESVIDLRVSFDGDLAARRDGQGCGQLALEIVDGHPTDIVTSLVSQLNQNGMYIRQKAAPANRWLADVYNRKQQVVGCIQARAAAPHDAIVELTMPESGALLALADRAITASGYRLGLAGSIGANPEAHYADETGSTIAVVLHVAPKTRNQLRRPTSSSVA